MRNVSEEQHLDEQLLQQARNERAKLLGCDFCEELVFVKIINSKLTVDNLYVFVKGPSNVFERHTGLVRSQRVRVTAQEVFVFARRSFTEHEESSVVELQGGQSLEHFLHEDVLFAVVAFDFELIRRVMIHIV